MVERPALTLLIESSALCAPASTTSSIYYRRAFSAALRFRKCANRLRQDAEDEGHPLPRGRRLMPVPGLDRATAGKGAGEVPPAGGTAPRTAAAGGGSAAGWNLRTPCESAGRPLQDSLFLPRCDCGGRGSWNREREHRAAKGNRPRHRAPEAV